MPAYIPVQYTTDPGEIASESFDYIESRVPGWLPSPGNLEAWLVESQALIAGELRTLLVQVPDSIFEYFGSTVLGLPPAAAVPATGRTTWTARDGAGYTVPAGTILALTPPGSNESFTFTLDSDVVFAAGIVVVHAAQITALEPGAAASGLTGTLSVLDPLDYITDVTLDAPTSGGSDAEASDAYRNRLSALLTLLSPRPILPQDFAVICQTLVAGVARATAIDLYNPETDTHGVPRCVTTAICDNQGEPCSPEIKAECDDLLQSMREVNFLAFVIDPTYTVIDVSYSVVAYSGYELVDLQTRIDDQLRSYLNPANWGVPPINDTSARSWLNETTVRYLEIAEQINLVQGVHYISAGPAIGIGGGALAMADIEMAGPAPLTRAGTITGSVTGPPL